MSKNFIYNSGIERTNWKSTMLNEKLNPLRVALQLAPRTTALTNNQYDKEVVSTLRTTDFSESLRQNSKFLI